MSNGTTSAAAEIADPLVAPLVSGRTPAEIFIAPVGGDMVASE
jgi:hypothetical protein